jgi:proline dehydrogenase
MLRSALLWASTNPTLAQRLPRYGFVRRAVRRFMPGEEAADALREAERLAAGGVPTLLTELGENVTTEAEARGVTDTYLRLVDEIRRRDLDAELSVKPTHLGIDQGVALAARHLGELVAACGEGVVWIDMEASAYVDATLDLYREVRAQHENVGICLQSYLHRTVEDFDALLEHRPHVRLVKGAYREAPSVAMPRKRDVDAAYRTLASRMLRERAAGRLGRPAIATHDRNLVGDAQRVAFELGLDPERWEVAMLYGIGTAEQERLVRAGTPLRVLISYGEHWFPWYMRRLAERPANVAFVLKQLVAR